MAKKLIVFLIVVLVLGAGGFFYWQNQTDIRELNKNLPDGVKVEKSLFGNEYKVVNKIDEYEFKVPEEWKGVKEAEYIPDEPKRQVENCSKITSIGMEGVEGGARLLSLDVCILPSQDIELKKWAQDLWRVFGLEGELIEDQIKDKNIIKALEEKNLGGTYVYFLKQGLKMYVINNGSEDFIREIILSGKW